MSVINNNFRLNYIPARIRDAKELTVFYSFRDPQTDKMRRIIQRHNHLRGKYPKKQILQILSELVLEINYKLSHGINPLLESSNPKMYTKIPDVLELFIKIKEKEMRPDGLRSYKSFVKKLNTWVLENMIKGNYISQFDKNKAVDFLTSIELDQNIGARSYNNHLVFYRTLWNWLIEKNYCTENVFEKFKKKSVEEKFRSVIPNKEHIRIMDYCRKEMPEMEIVIDLVRAAFIRPAEICRVQIVNIKLDEGVIEIPSGKSKNKKFRYAYLTGWLCEKIKRVIDPDIYPENFYLVTRNLKPGTKNITTREIDKKWEKIRNGIDLAMEYQLYSYRDTGITFLEKKKVPRSVIQKLTDHHSEKMVGKYVGEAEKEMIEEVIKEIV
jgi:integrase